MGYADIPPQVLSRLASERMRMYHALWHFVRDKPSWEGLPPAQKQPLIDEGWTPPRFAEEDGAGTDFLFMHRRMIEMVNAWAQQSPPDGSGGGDGHGHNGGNDHGSGAADTSKHKGASAFVVGWLDVPWDHNDPVWPMPEVDLTIPGHKDLFGRSKDYEVTLYYRGRCADEFNDRTYLSSVTLDAFGTELEGSIHGWFHMHWSASPPANPNSLDTSNDWLGSPFSSHVNRHFWKLHGWIDDRIRAWEDANGRVADLSGGWDGPPDYVTGEIHSADPKFFRLLEFAERPPLVMPWKDLLLEVSR